MDHLRTAEALAELLDDKFKIVGLRFGIDPLLNFLPIGGSVIGLLLATYIIWIAAQEELPIALRRRMALHVVADFVIGLIPVVGWVGDFFVRANIKNIKLLHQYLDERPLEGKVIVSS